MPGREQNHSKTMTFDSPRRIAVFIYPDICTLDTVGPLEAFAMANDLAAQAGHNQPFYDLCVVALTLDPVPTSTGFAITPNQSIDRLDFPLDTLLVSGGDGRIAASRDERVMAFLRLASRRVRRYGSICTGAFALAAAGLLDGKLATTHWASAAELRRLYPRVKVQEDRIFTRDGNIYTSAGISAGIDLALALIEDDHGRPLAMNVARGLVVPFRRTGGQSQFSTHLQAQFATIPAVLRVQDWAAENLTADLSIEALAQRAGMSPRTFARVFKDATGGTPAVFVARLRTDRARELLEDTTLQLQVIATRCGFHSVDSMRRVFVEHVGVKPAQYRERFYTV